MNKPLTTLLLVLGAISLCRADTRTLTNQDGASIEVELLEVTDYRGQESIHVKREVDQRKFYIPINNLSFKDQREVRDWWKEQQKEKEILKPDVDLEFSFKSNRKKESQYNSSYSDDDDYFFEPVIEIVNDDLYQSYTDCKVRLVCFARHTKYKNSLEVTSVTEKTVNLPRKQTTYVQGSPYKFNNYKSELSDYEFGWEDAGYIAIVKNSKGDVTHIDTNNSRYERALDVVMKVKEDEYYSTDLRVKLNSYSSY